MIFGKYPYFKKALRAVHGAKRSLLHAVPYTQFPTQSMRPHNSYLRCALRTIFS